MMFVWAMLAGLALDALIGDPEWFPHPVRLIGRYISWMEGILRARAGNLRRAAVWLTLSTVVLTMLATALALWLLSLLGRWPLFAGMALISWMCLSRKCLSAEAMGVSSALERSLADGRRQVARIVGRDTAQLNSEEIVKATVETVAENTTDGVISPMIYLMLGGPVLGMGFKAASTLDSMVGYLDEKYRDIGWSSARLDDVLNYVPARLCALLLCASAWFLGLDACGAWRIVRRDHANHKSPNCAWSEAAAAGALGIQLGGTHLYFGKPVEKPTIGDALRPATSGMIRQTCRLMTVATLLAAGICAACALGIAL